MTNRQSGQESQGHSTPWTVATKVNPKRIKTGGSPSGEEETLGREGDKRGKTEQRGRGNAEAQQKARKKKVYNLQSPTAPRTREFKQNRVRIFTVPSYSGEEFDE